jgi:hypothetical protein
MQNACSSAAHAGIRGVSPSPPMPPSPTTKIAHVQSDGRSRAREASPGRSKEASPVGARRLRIGAIDARA